MPFDAEVTGDDPGAAGAASARVDIPGARSAEPPKPSADAAGAAARAASPKPATPAARAGKVDGLDLTVEQARRIDEFYTTLATRDAFELLEITRTADKKDIKRAYFKLSKELHPDRFFGKNIGPYRERLSKIFQSVKAAYELLSDDARRAAYLESGK